MVFSTLDPTKSYKRQKPRPMSLFVETCGQGWLRDYKIVRTTAATRLFCRGGKIESRLLKFCQSHATPLSGTANCDLAKFKQRAVTFSLVKIVRPRQWKSLQISFPGFREPGNQWKPTETCTFCWWPVEDRRAHETLGTLQTSNRRNLPGAWLHGWVDYSLWCLPRPGVSWGSCSWRYFRKWCITHVLDGRCAAASRQGIGLLDLFGSIDIGEACLPF